MRSHVLIGSLIFLLGTAGLVWGENTPLEASLQSHAAQAEYLARHPEILRWIGKHPGEVRGVADRTADADHRAKNNLINEWIVSAPELAAALADDPAQALVWADDPKVLADLGKKGRKER
jgi:hypothetical protein